MTTRCQGFWGELFGHKFHDVFETKRNLNITNDVMNILSKSIQSTYGSLDANEANPFEEVIHALKISESVYIHSICPRCGEIIKKTDDEINEGDHK